MTYTFYTATEALPSLASAILKHGQEVGSRNGRTMELLDTQIVLTQPNKREILCPSRGANVFAQIAETMWVLAGRNDVDWLSAYLPRAKDYADDGVYWRAGYGPRLRDFRGIDQLARVVDMLRKDPLSRQAVIQIWDVSDGDVDLPLKDRACNTQLQFQSRLGKLSLTVTVRSNDLMWGWSGINAFEWSTLQEIVASLLGIEVGPLVFNIGSLHIYAPYWGKAQRIVEDSRDPVHHNIIEFNPDGVITTVDEVDELLERWFIWEEMCRGGEATTTLLDDFEEPLFKAWGAAIAYYWTREETWLGYFAGTALGLAVALTPSSLFPEPVRRPHGTVAAPGPAATPRDPQEAFLTFVQDLHAKKHASYGDSWKKRGEALSILPNIARKIDRLGVGDEFDSSADTVIDLWVYLAKYYCWLHGEEADPQNVNAMLHWSLHWAASEPEPQWDHQIPQTFDEYADTFGDLETGEKIEIIRDLMNRTAPVAFDQWYSENEYRGADQD